MPGSPLQEFEWWLTISGQRLTPDRALIAGLVFQFDAPFFMEDLEAQLGQCDGRRISRATVYRTLSFLVGARLVQKSSGPERDTYIPLVGSDNA